MPQQLMQVYFNTKRLESKNLQHSFIETLSKAANANSLCLEAHNELASMSVTLTSLMLLGATLNTGNSEYYIKAMTLLAKSQMLITMYFDQVCTPAHINELVTELEELFK